MGCRKRRRAAARDGAATWRALVAKLKVLVPELLELNAPERALPDEFVVESV